MKKSLYTFVLAGMLGLAACSSPAEEGAEERQEELEDSAEERADEMEDTAEDADTSAVIE